MRDRDDVPLLGELEPRNVCHRVGARDLCHRDVNTIQPEPDVVVAKLDHERLLVGEDERNEAGLSTAGTCLHRPEILRTWPIARRTEWRHEEVFELSRTDLVSVQIRAPVQRGSKLATSKGCLPDDRHPLALIPDPSSG
jgi:hypothetical protein